MLDRLLPHLARPKAFQLSDGPFWDDPHLSSGLLAAHLDPSTPAASRPPAELRSTVDALLTQGLAWQGCRVLDLGCGPGLVATLLAEAGCHVTGVDLSSRSLEHARRDAQARGIDIEYRLEDFRTLREESEYDVVLQSYGELSTLSPGDLHAVLTAVRRSLRPHGHLVADLSTVDNRRHAEPTTWSVDGSGFWRPHDHLLLTTHHTYGDRVWCNQYVVVDRDICAYRMWFTDHTPETARTVLDGAGLRLLRCTDGLSDRPWTGVGDWMGIVAART